MSRLFLVFAAFCCGAAFMVLWIAITDEFDSSEEPE
jgi:hypothetical protein